MRRRLETSAAIIAGIAIVAAGGCSAGQDEQSVASSNTGEATTTSASSISEFALPEREGARRETTRDVPHIQLDALPVAAVDAELRRRAFLLPGVEDLPSDRSLPGARGLALPDDLELARPDVISGSREFAHIHPDGSLHVWLPADRALEVDRTKWGELHPWVGRDGFWEGVVMVYTPETLDELDVTIRLVVDAYNFVTGASLEPSDIP
ncbi:phospholipase [Ilumatobacter sp.]|uniref:luciferase domain-containing protein n=1 Tax=Ilumatobacter sp. TaxID=1967498 RepID=UPI003AF9338F